MTPSPTMKPGDIVYSAKPEYGENLLVVVTEVSTYDPKLYEPSFCGVAIKGPLAPNYAPHVYCSYYHVLDRARYNAVLREFNYIGNTDSFTDFDSSRRINPGDIVTLPSGTPGLKSFVVVTSVRYVVYALKREGYWVLDGFLFGCAEGPHFVYGKHFDNYAVIPVGTDAYRGVLSLLSACNNPTEVPCVNTHTVKFTTEDKLQALTQRVIALEKLTQPKPHSEDPLGPTPADLQAEVARLNALLCDYREELWKRRRNAKRLREYVSDARRSTKKLGDTSCITMESLRQFWKLIKEYTADDAEDSKEKCEYNTSHKSNPPDSQLGPTVVKQQKQIAVLNAELEFTQSVLKTAHNALDKIREARNDIGKTINAEGKDCYDEDTLKCLLEVIRKHTEPTDD